MDPITAGRLVRSHRRRKGLTQADTARATGATQSQISFYEAGRTGVLSKERIEALAKLLEIDAASLLEVRQSAPPTVSYCGNWDCPSNDPYVSKAGLIFRPRFTSTPPSMCLWCGEPLQQHCSNCSSAIVPRGMNCGTCGDPYVETPEDAPQHDLDRWASMRRERNLALLGPQEHVSPPAAALSREEDRRH